jgi:CRP/FNR family transcriptional regulator, cyclic AMP receptor protein
MMFATMKVGLVWLISYIIMNLEKYAHLAFFTGLQPADIQLLAPYFAPQTWVAGTVIFEQDDYAEYLYLVVSGEVSIRFKPHDGPVMTVTRVQPGGIFGWSAAMNNPAYTSGAVCSLDSEVLRIRGTDLRAICEKHPELGRIILDRLAGVIAERKESRQIQVSSFLANEIRQQTKN